MSNKKLPESFMFLMICYRAEVTKLINQSDTGVSLAQCKVLKVVMMVENCTPMDIARANHLEKAQVTRIVKELIEKDIVNKVANPNDKRSQMLSITEKGLSVMNKIKKLEQSILAKMTEGVSESEIEHFNQIANRFSDNLFTMG